MTIKNTIKKWVKLLTCEQYRFMYNTARGKNDSLSDEVFLKKWYFLMLNQELNLDNPQTFNEKMQWLKINDRRSEYTMMVDKYRAKIYVAKIIGEEHIIPTLGVWSNYDEIDFSELPNQFVLKSTHDSGGVVIIDNKDKLGAAVKEKLERSLKNNYYYRGREWPYKNVKPRIIAEKYMQDGNHAYLPVFKIFCFNGVPKIIQSIQNDKQADETIDYFDTDWNLLELKQNFPNSKTPLEKPQKLNEMLELAKKLAGDRPFIRVDFYIIDNVVYFSEFTFYSDSGFQKFEPADWDFRLGSWIELPIER